MPIAQWASSSVTIKLPNSGLWDLAWCLLIWDSQPVCPYQHVLYWLLCWRSDPGKICNLQQRKFALKQWTEINESWFACNCIPEKHIPLVHPGERELTWVQATNPRARGDHSGQSHCTNAQTEVNDTGFSTPVAACQGKSLCNRDSSTSAPHPAA